jgi:hypothetical protein
MVRLFNFQRRRLGLVAIFILVEISSGQVSFSQYILAANQGQTVYVDGSTGLDSSSGTSSRPLRTLAAAARLAMMNYNRGISTTVVIRPGVYRESITMNTTISGAASSPSISFIAATPGSVTVTGADLWSNWQTDYSNPLEYIHPWAFQWGPCTLPDGWPTIQPIVGRREIVFLNGTLLRQVMSQDDLANGTFYVEDQSGAIRIRPPEGMDMSTAVIEVGTRPHLLNIHGISNLTISGLTFVKAATCLPGGSVELFDSSNDSIMNCVFEWNNWEGLVLHNVSNLTISDVRASHNGAVGISGYRLKNLNLQDSETSFNNWRGAWGGFYFQSQSGVKIMRTHDSIFRNLHSFGNQTSGLWFDTDNANILVENAYLSSNQFNGLILEANQGPIKIEHSRICQNHAEGVLIPDSDHISIESTVIFGNKGGQILVDGMKKVRIDHDWETNLNYASKSQFLTLQGDTIVATDPEQMLFKTYQVDADTSAAMFSTLISNSNVWYNSSNQRSFQYDPELSRGQKAHDMDFEQWRSLTGQDKDSRFAPPRQEVVAACASP